MEVKTISIAKDDLINFGKAVEAYVRPETLPVAINMLKSRADIPDGMKTAEEQIGATIALCQAWGKARFNGESLAMFKEDISCPIALFTLGMADPPATWSEGNLYLNWYTPDPKAAENLAKGMYKLPKGEYAGVAMSPIHTCNFEPDVVIIYCTPPQLLRFIAAALMREGGRFESSIFPPGVCTEIIAPIMQKGKCRFGIPCFGDRKYEYTSKDELVFSVPFARLEEIAEGLKFFYEHGHELPMQRPLDHASAQLETYKKLRTTL